MELLPKTSLSFFLIGSADVSTVTRVSSLPGVGSQRPRGRGGPGRGCRPLNSGGGGGGWHTAGQGRRRDSGRGCGSPSTHMPGKCRPGSGRREGRAGLGSSRTPAGPLAFALLGKRAAAPLPATALALRESLGEKPASQLKGLQTDLLFFWSRLREEQPAGP